VPDLRQDVPAEEEIEAGWSCGVARPIWRNRWATARRVAGISFPQRPVLKLDRHGYSPMILHRILHIVGVTIAFEMAETALKVVGEISI
jgi:hypothetical protein